jgi:hypothetical protein
MRQVFAPANAERFQAALRRFEEENSRDPNFEEHEGVRRPRELVYADWLSEWVLRLSPNASEELRLVARCQHLCRWEIPRESYAMTRAGYLKWREDLKKFHARKAGEILREVGYPEDVIGRVQNLNLKKNFPRDPESQVLEDALCLVFLERQLTELCQKASDEKMVDALQKVWKKMSPGARGVARTLPYGEHEHSLLERAVADFGAEPRD